MKSPEQLKGAIRNIAQNNHLYPQEVLQMFLFERILERLSVSPYRDNFIIKGGLLISSMIGINERTTMDLDTTVRGITMEKTRIVQIMKEIMSINVGDGIEFEFRKIEPIRDDDTYNNYRVHIHALYGKMNNPMKIDITTGDKITPAAVEYSFPMMFKDKEVPIMAYSLETILAEKYETILRRNIANTRIRDFYDLYILFKLYRNMICRDLLKLAVEHTSAKRNSTTEIQEYEQICHEIRREPALEKQWINYALEHEYAGELSYADVVQNVYDVGEYLRD